MLKLITENKQELFNNAYHGVMKQGKPSIRPDGRCLYHGGKDVACGIGHNLTPEDRAELDWLGEVSIQHLVITNRVRVKTVSIDFLRDLQVAHDNAVADSADGEDTFMNGFTKNMTNLAETYGLGLPNI